MNNRQLQDIENALIASPQDSPERVALLNELAWTVWGTDLERARQAVVEALEIAERIGDEKGIAYARRSLGIHYYTLGDNETGFRMLHDANQWFEANDERRGIADVRVNLSYVYWSLGDFKKGLDMAESALRIYHEENLRAGEGWALTALGGFYSDFKDYRRSLDYNTRAFDVFVELEDHTGRARALNGLGNAHHNLGDRAKALQLQEESLAAFALVDNEFGSTKTLNDIGLILQAESRHEEALVYHHRALAMRNKRDYLQGQCTCLLDIGNAYIALRNYDEAEAHLSRALVMAEKIANKSKQCRAHELFSYLYRDLGRFNEAFVHFENFHRLTEEMFHENADQRVKNLRAAHEIEAAAREAEIERLKNVELRDKNAQLQEAMHELRDAQAQLLSDGKMAALGNLVAGLAHEINTPLGAIVSAQDVSKRAVDRLRHAVDGAQGAGTPGASVGEAGRLMGLLHASAENAAEAAGRISKIVRSLRSFTRLDESPFQKVDVHEGIEAAITLLEPEIPERVTVRREFDDAVPAIFMYPGEMNQVFMNLISNAVQAIDGKGEVVVRTAAGSGSIRVEIADTGRGIAPERVDKLFEPGFTRKQSTVRMRTGLYTSHHIVRNHLGELTVNSQVGEGTTFRVTIPDHLERLLGVTAREA